MDLFTSDRERRLWFWVLFVLAWIYATLGPAYVLAAQLRQRNLLQKSFAFVLLLVVAVIAWRWVKQRPGRLDGGRGKPGFGASTGQGRLKI